MAQIFAWLPLAIILLVFWLFARSSSKQYKNHVNDVNAINQQIVDTNREMIAELKEIKQLLRHNK